jgi:isocitrate lyase
MMMDHASLVLLSGACQINEDSNSLKSIGCVAKSAAAIHAVTPTPFFSYIASPEFSWVHAPTEKQEDDYI